MKTDVTNCNEVDASSSANLLTAERVFAIDFTVVADRRVRRYLLRFATGIHPAL